MKKRLCLILAVAAIGLCGCGNKDTNEGPSAAIVKEITCQELLDTVLEKGEGLNTDSTLYYDAENYEELFKYLYDTSPDRAADGAYAYASSAFADEVTIIRATETDDVEVIKGHLEDRIDRRMQDFNGYKPEEVEKLENAVIDTYGRYVFMVVSENPQDIIDVINEEIAKKDE
jgi:hypothetical protein